MDVVGVPMGGNYDLIPGEIFREPQTDLMGDPQGDLVIRTERLDDMVVGSAVFLMELPLGKPEFFRRRFGHTMDAGDQGFVCFLAVHDVWEDIVQRASRGNEFNDCHSVATSFLMPERSTA